MYTPSQKSDTIASRITALRKLRGLSQSELARSLGVSAQSVQQWESGRTEPKPKRVKEIADSLGVSTYWLQTGDDPPLGATAAETIDTATLPQPIRAEVELLIAGLRDGSIPLERFKAAMTLLLA